MTKRRLPEELSSRLKDVKEFYEMDSVNKIIDDLSTFCVLERKYLEKHHKQKMDNDTYEELKRATFYAGLSRFYKIAYEITKSYDSIKEFKYIKRSNTEILREIVKLYDGDNK